MARRKFWNGHPQKDSIDASASPHLASLKLWVEPLESRDVPAIILIETTTITTALGQTADLTVTADDVNDAGEVYRWNYHLANVSANYANSGDPVIGIGLFDVITTANSVDPLSVTSPTGWGVYLGDNYGDPGLIRWTGGGEFDPGLLPGESVDFGFEMGAVDIIEGTAQFADPGFAMPAQGPAKVPGATAPVDYDAIYNKLIALLLDRPPTIAAVVGDTQPEDVLGPKWQTWAGQFNAEVQKIRNPLAHTQLFILLENITDNGVRQAIDDAILAADATPFTTLPVSVPVKQVIDAGFQSISSNVRSTLTTQAVLQLPARIVGQDGLLAWVAQELATPPRDYTNVLPAWITQLKSADYQDRANAMQAMKDDLLRYAALEFFVGNSQYCDLLYLFTTARLDLQIELIGLTVGSAEYTRVNNAILCLNQVIDFGERSYYIFVTRPSGQDPGCLLPIC